MIVQVQLAFLLTVATLVYGNVTATIEQSHVTTVKTLHIAYLDKIFDKLQPYIRNFILKNGLDPMELLDVSKSFIPALPGKLKGSLDLKNGWLQGLSRIKRSKHIIAFYANKRLVLNMDLGFDLLDCSYKYYAQYLLAKRQGDVYGRFHDIDIKVVIMIDMRDYRMSLEYMKFMKVRKYDIKLEGHLVDPILNLVYKVITVLFRNEILSHIESCGFKMFHEIINEWNKRFLPSNEMKLIENWFYSNILNV